MPKARLLWLIDVTQPVQCEHVRSVAASRVESVRGSVGPAILAEVRSIIGLLLDIG